MLKKLFIIAIILGAIYSVLGFNLEIRQIATTEEERQNQEEQIEEIGIELVNKSIAIAKEIETFGRQTNLQKKIVEWSETQNQITKTLNSFINYLIFPITLGLNLINLLFNCTTILTGIDYRTNISTTSVFYTSDFTNGTSYGGGGGSFQGGID